MNPADFALPIVEWPRFLVGAFLFLLPGLAAADRLVQGGTRFILAPVLSFTLLPIAGILLSFATPWRATAGSTALLAVLLAALCASRRIADALETAPERRPGSQRVLPQEDANGAPQSPTTTSPASRTYRALAFVAVVAVALFAGLVHAVPHMPEPGSLVTPFNALPELAGRTLQAWETGPYLYPVHVDEHMHLAHSAFIVRNGTLADPYTGERFDVGIFSLRGDVHERGFHMGFAQLSLLTGASLPLLYLFGPAAWASLLALLVWGLMRPHPGAIASAALVAILPTSTLFLGASFLVPIAFGLAWVLATAWFMLRSKGGPRIVALLLVVTGAFFIHLVAGAACLVMAACAAAVLELPWRFRVGLAATALVPLAWVGPAIADEVLGELGQPAAHSLGQPFFTAIGWPAWILFVAGAAAAITLRRHRPLLAVSAFGIAVATVVAGALLTGHTSLALYYRSSHLLFLAAAILAGHAIGLCAHALARWHVPRAAAALLAVLLLVVAASPGVASHLEEPYYRVHDDASWAAARTLAAADPGPEEVFLSEPWRAMLYNAVSGATPYTVLYPGSPPARGGDWAFYLRSGGASAAWLEDRQITYVVASVPPQAPHEHLGQGVYRIL